MRSRIVLGGGTTLVALFAGYACGTNLPASTDTAPEAGVDSGDGGAPIDDEPPPADAGGFADVVGIDAAFTSCAENALIARWRFDETSGTVVADCSGGGNHGVRLGGEIVPGAPSVQDSGSAVSFAGGAWVGFGVRPSLDIAGAFTVSAWIEPGDMDDTRYIVGKSVDYSVDGWRLAYRSESGRNISFGMAFDDGEGIDGCFAIGGDVPANEWAHVAGVFRPNEGLEVYVNGKLAATSSSCKPSAVVPSASEARVGARADGAATFIGTIDDVRIYGRALARSEVEGLAK